MGVRFEEKRRVLIAWSRICRRLGLCGESEEDLKVMVGVSLRCVGEEV